MKPADSLSVPVEADINPETISKEMERRDQYKLYVTNLKNWMSQKEASKLFTEKAIPGIKFVFVFWFMSRGVKKQRGKQFAFVTFNTIEERDTAWKLIEEIEVEGKKLKCKEVFCCYSDLIILAQPSEETG